MNIRIPYTLNQNVYINIYTSDLTQIWNGSAFVTPVLLNWITYSFSLVDSTNSGLYEGNFPPTIPNGTYVVQALAQATPVPLPTDTLIGYASFVQPGGSITIATNQSLSNVSLADTYFASRMYTQVWDALDYNSKQKFLNMATSIINKFRYLGLKSDPNQINEWPRQNVYLDYTLVDSTTIPQDILNAQYEIAVALAKGIDPEREIRSLRVTSRGYSSVRTTYDSKVIPEYLILGIPSAVAFDYLRAYLDLNAFATVTRHRVS